MNTQEAIDRSISHNEIVTLDDNPETREELGELCEDSAKNGNILEFWGERDGENWRVHLKAGPNG